ncbi:MAG: HAD-IA family hydrolase [Gammaproteobacteria bacterium]|nr:HAD-IA family hydrolase [Gammaproteobacteria bacterium]
MQRYKAILWDFGGVFTTSPFDAFARYEREHDLPRDFIRSVNARNHETNAWALFESNRCTLEDFDHLFEAEARAAGHALPGRVVIGLLGGDLRPRMVEVLKRCKQDYRCVCLTNNMNTGNGTGTWGTRERAAAVADVMQLFDLVIESSKEGMRKPDPRIYALACERMGVVPAEVVYLDDLGINLKPAKHLGMTTLKVTSEAQAIADLAATLGIVF